MKLAWYKKPCILWQVEFESGNDLKLSMITPPDAFNKTAGYIYLDDEEPEVTVKGKVAQPGEYVFVIHYYQPDYPGNYFNNL